MNEDDQDSDSVKLISCGGKKRAEGVTLLYRKYATPIKLYFLNRGRSPEQAEDLLQEVFIQIIRKIDTYRAEGKFSAWIWTIARNTLTSEFRKSSNKQTYVDLEENLAAGIRSGSPVDPVEDGYKQCVRDAFEDFNQNHQERAQALTLSVFHGWNIKELAAFLGRTRAATREYLSQSRKKLRPFLEPCYEYLAP